MRAKASCVFPTHYSAQKVTDGQLLAETNGHYPDIFAIRRREPAVVQVVLTIARYGTLA
jgi:hypothetical protein